MYVCALPNGTFYSLCLMRMYMCTYCEKRSTCNMFHRTFVGREAGGAAVYQGGGEYGFLFHEGRTPMQHANHATSLHIAKAR